MHLTLRQLEIFVAVADRGTTTAAGAAIALSQSAVSGALAELESLLGARLFDRIGKRLALNDAGRGLLPQARVLLDGARGIERKFGIGTKTGLVDLRLKIGASTTIGNYLLPDLIAGFCADAAQAQVDVLIGNTREIASAVARLDVDVGLVEGPSHERGLRMRPWLVDELVVVCAPLHPLALANAARRVTLAQLRDASWLLREAGSGTREAVEQILLPQLHQVDGTMDFGSTEAIKQAVAAGLGVSCLSRYAVQDLIALGRLVVLETPLKALSRRFYLIQHRQKQFSKAMERFVAYCFDR